MRRFRFTGTECDEGCSEFAGLLARAYRAKVKPHCLCREQGIKMYVAHIGNQLVIKRMPLSGREHDPSCASYEPPYEVSGLGALMGTAIQMDTSIGKASLKLDFSLSRRGAVNRSTPVELAGGSIKTEGRKLSLRALLHLLWHESGLTEWTAHWTGKRHWWQVYHHLLEAAGNMSVRGESLVERLVLPEPFKIEDKAAIEQRRALKMRSLFQAGQKRLMVLSGEVKEFGEARDGRRVVIRHMPGFRLHLGEAAWNSLQRKFQAEFALWQSDDSIHLMMIATIGGGAAGIVSIDEIALMCVSQQWLPIENAFEQALVERLARLRSKSVKSLRYNLGHRRALANAILLETRPRPYALYIVPPAADDTFEEELSDMIDARPDLDAWIWRVAEGEMPALPA